MPGRVAVAAVSACWVGRDVDDCAEEDDCGRNCDAEDDCPAPSVAGVPELVVCAPQKGIAASNSDSSHAARRLGRPASRLLRAPAEQCCTDSASDRDRRARAIERLPSRKAASAPVPLFTEFAKMLSRTTVKEPLRGLRHRVPPPWSCLEHLPIAGNPVNAAFDAPFPPGKGSASRRPQGHGNRTCSRHAEYGSITLGQMQGANQRPAGPVTRLLILDTMESVSNVAISDTERYSRQILFAPIGQEGQQRLARSTVAIVRCGATRAAAAALLARAGVGTLILIDRDFVEESNLQRQVLFDEADAAAATPKAEAARRHIPAFNSGLGVTAHIAD